jgi:hypothetical protein
MVDAHGHFHGLDCQSCVVLGIHAPPELVHTAEACAETCRHANMMSEDTASLTTPRLWDRPLVEAGKQPTPGRTIEQSRDLDAIAGLIGPDRCLSLRRKDAIDGSRVKPKLAQILLRHLDVAWG